KKLRGVVKMLITLNIHEQLKAKEIYFGVWKPLYNKFEDKQKRHGIYFYSYGDSKIPFYIGKCTAESYNILGRVWQELDDYKNGRYWLCRQPEKYKDLTCFKDNYSKENYFKPNSDIEEEEFKTVINEFLNRTVITFSYITYGRSNSNDKAEIISSVESYMQKKLVNDINLEPNWIGDGGDRLKKQSEQFDFRIVFKYIMDKNYNELDQVLWKK
ncbi:MAG: hypothetical protein ACOCRO_07015, partial [Halanaerobiales bacterium]